MFVQDRTPGGRPRVTCRRCGASEVSRVASVLTGWKVRHDKDCRNLAAVLADVPGVSLVPARSLSSLEGRP